MIRQYDAQKLCDDKLRELGLYSKGWRTCFSKSEQFTAACYYDEKRIQISTMYLNTCSEVQLKETILHECAHALIGPDKGHGWEWTEKAREIGLKDPKPCRFVNWEAGKSIQPSESKPKRQFHRLDKVCPVCGVKAEEVSRAKFGDAHWTKLKCGHLVKSESIKGSGFDFDKWESATGKRPFPYQIDGIKFLESSGGRALIADEPGLGKTIQAIGFALAHAEDVCPILWVCKTTLKLQASKEFVDWAGPAWMAQIITSPRNFIMPGLKVYIISMDLLRNMPTDKLDAIGFKTVVADEIQHFKNPDSTRTAELRKLVTKSEYFIPLSGTPWKNRGQEYFPVLNMLDPIRFPSYENFKNRWVDVYLDTKTMKYRQGGIKNIPVFREYTKDLVIRRMRDDVLPDLPKINRQIRYVDMGELYEKAYNDMEVKVAEYIKQAYLGENMNMRLLGAEIMKLKHITGLAKVGVAVEDAIEFIENAPEEDKMTIFHHHIDVGNHLQHGDHAKTFEGLDTWLVQNGWNPTLRLFGGRSSDERNDVIQKFKDDPKNRILIASTLASGEGLNIQFCQNAMMLERQWNPANEEQAELRFSRPLTRREMPEYLQNFLFDGDGNQKKVSIRVPYFIADGTVDSMLTELVERKRLNFRRSMNKGEENIKWEENEIMAELADMILKKRFGKASKIPAQLVEF